MEPPLTCSERDKDNLKGPGKSLRLEYRSTSSAHDYGIHYPKSYTYIPIKMPVHNRCT